MKLPFRPADISSKPTASCTTGACIEVIIRIGQLGPEDESETIDAFATVPRILHRQPYDNSHWANGLYIQWLCKHYLPWRNFEVGKKLLQEMDSYLLEAVGCLLSSNLLYRRNTVDFSKVFQKIFPATTTATKVQKND